ncbi:MAG TPA: succinate dehydrogenase, cytochrome b556 subunit, partial [Methylophilaceae bacterium]|nr:succinate dehydrogenase, cytochrome b556 subunit [Methylophilaceae bacterium]
MIKKQPVRKRPKNLNLFTIRIPVNAVVSILHRASGVLLFLVLPVLLWCWQVSLTNEMGYWHMEVLLQHWFSKLLMIGLALAFFYHFFGGLRHLG